MTSDSKPGVRQRSGTDDRIDRLAALQTNGMRRSEKVAESVAREIIRSVSGLEPGTRLPSESAMLDAYGVSRASLREALRILEVQGLVTMKPGPGGGPIMLGPSPEDLGKTQTLFFHLLDAKYSDLLDTLVAIEPLVAREAAERRDRKAVEPLRVFLHERPDVDDTEQYRWHSVGFHSTLAAVCGNPVLGILVRSLREIVVIRLGSAMFSENDERSGIVHAHEAVAQAVLDGDAEAAHQAMKRHLDEFSLRANDRHSGLLAEKIDWH